MATKRDGVFVWITWLARVMAGEQNCECASWFKAHYETTTRRRATSTLRNGTSNTRFNCAGCVLPPWNHTFCYDVPLSPMAAGFSPPTPTERRHSSPLADSRSSGGSQL